MNALIGQIRIQSWSILPILSIFSCLNVVGLRLDGFGRPAMEISANTFLVSGGASGLGGATSRLLASSGANVVIADINKERGEALAAELGANTRFVECNVTDEESVKNAVAAAASNFGKLDGAINCAGIGIAEKTVGKDGPHALASFKKVIEVNLIGTFNVIRLAAA